MDHNGRAARVDSVGLFEKVIQERFERIARPTLAIPNETTVVSS
jgi:hypothetical protein